MPSWNDLGTAFNTLRELDVSAISEESERPVAIACLGPRPLFSQVVARLRAADGSRYGPVGLDPLFYQPMPEREPGEDLRRADMLLILVDGREPISSSTARSLARLGGLSLPTAIVICSVSSPGDIGRLRPEFAHARIVVLPDLAAPEAAGLLAAAILDLLPQERHLAAARALPGLRPIYARELVGSVSFSNATYSLASAIPEQVPVLSVPFAAADILVLTKNQALMVYRLALAYGAPPEFQARMAEIAPVVGGAFVWRQAARTLIGLIPVWGVVPKVSIAYAGTYVTGMAAWRWFAEGQLLSQERMKALGDEAMRAGRDLAAKLVAAAREQGVKTGWRLGARKDRKGDVSGKGQSASLSSGDEPPRNG